MRTTLRIDDDALRAARSIARERNTSLGEAVSALIRKAIASEARYSIRNDFPVFAVREDAPLISDEDIRRAEDEL